MQAMQVNLPSKIGRPDRPPNYLILHEPTLNLRN
jgi:hypothetical protein